MRRTLLESITLFDRETIREGHPQRVDAYRERDTAQDTLSERTLPKKGTLPKRNQRRYSELSERDTLKRGKFRLKESAERGTLLEEKTIWTSTSTETVTARRDS